MLALWLALLLLVAVVVGVVEAIRDRELIEIMPSGAEVRTPTAPSMFGADTSIAARKPHTRARKIEDFSSKTKKVRVEHERQSNRL
jgi:hypothetical protein